MKWLLVLAIVLFAAFQLRRELIRHRVLGPVFRVLLERQPARRMTARDYLSGSLLFFAFAVLAGACHTGLSWLSENASWAGLGSPLAAAFVKTSLWVAAIAAVAGVATLVEGVRRAIVNRRSVG